jgi:hypothetical protein
MFKRVIMVAFFSGVFSVDCSKANESVLRPLQEAHCAQGEGHDDED